MNTCTHCRMEVPTSARKCPYCLENPYDGFTGSVTRFFEYVFGAALVIGLIMLIF
jgi:hypothetical protein